MEIIEGKLVYEVLSAQQFSYRTAQAHKHFSELFPSKAMVYVVALIRATQH